MKTRSFLMSAVAFVFLLTGLAWAGPGDPVHFDDDKLKEAVKKELGFTTDPTEAQMLLLTELFAANKGITDLTGIEYAKNIKKLVVHTNAISSLSDKPFTGLTSLENLELPAGPILNADTTYWLAMTVVPVDTSHTWMQSTLPVSGLGALRYQDFPM